MVVGRQKAVRLQGYIGEDERVFLRAPCSDLDGTTRSTRLTAFPLFPFTDGSIGERWDELVISCLYIITGG